MHSTSTTGKTFSEAVAAGENDHQAQALGGYVVAKLDENAFVPLPTDKPAAKLSEIAAPDLIAGNAEIVARYQGSEGNWTRLDDST